MRIPTSIEAYFLGATTVLLASLVQHPRFDEIDVERLNVVEKDGTLRMTISNGARMPDPVIGGKSYPLRSGSKGRAGIIFFNEAGNENGGLTYSGKGSEQAEGLTMDQLNQDEVVTMGYEGRPGHHTGSFEVLDRPDTPIQVMAESLMVLRALPDGPEKTQRMGAFRAAMVKSGQGGYSRVFAGKTPDRTAIVMLSDTKGKPRLKLTVDSTGKAGIDFLDADGRVTDHFPEASRPSSQRP
jgi:hypothetical protein